VKLRLYLVLLKKYIIPHLLKELIAFYEIRRFISVFINSQHASLFLSEKGLVERPAAPFVKTLSNTSHINTNEMQLSLFIWFFITLHVSDAVCVHHQE